MPRKFSCEQNLRLANNHVKHESSSRDSHLVIKSNSKLRNVNRQLKSKYHRLTPVLTHNLNSYKPHSRPPTMRTVSQKSPNVSIHASQKFPRRIDHGPTKVASVTFGFCVCPACTATPHSHPTLSPAQPRCLWGNSVSLSYLWTRTS